MAKRERKTAPSAPPTTPRAVAVIDIGATSVRMLVAELMPDGTVRTLDSIQQPVGLGADCFSLGHLRRSTIEECVKALATCRRALQEYGINTAADIRAVATTAVREAANRDAFLDRVYMATGINVTAMDPSEVTRLTYLSIRARLRDDKRLSKGRLLVTEVGGGGTELLVLEKRNVTFSQTYRLGSLRIAEGSMPQASGRMAREVIENQIQRTLTQMQQGLPAHQPHAMVALGGDIRFAAAHLMPDWNRHDTVAVSLKALQALTEEMLPLSVDELVRRYHLSFPDAETLGPALLIYCRLAQSFSLDHLLVGDITMRDGLLLDTTVENVWSQIFGNQIRRAALELARRYHADIKHVQKVAKLACAVFDALGAHHRLSRRHEILLVVACLLHDIGLFVNARSHHKHSMYLIQASEIFGLSSHDLQLVALIARYHRGALPRASHSPYMALDREDRMAVSKLAAILRIADALDRSYSQRIRSVACTVEDGRLVLTVPFAGDLTLEQHALREKGSFFEDVYGMRPVLRSQSHRETAE